MRRRVGAEARVHMPAIVPAPPGFVKVASGYRLRRPTI